MSKPPIGFIGLGIMGYPMAGHIAKAGYPLTVYNRTRKKAERFVTEHAGCRQVDSPADVASRAEIIVVIVSDTPDVEEVILNEDGLLKAIRPRTLVIDMSTISPAAERRFDLAFRERGALIVDAPVSGGDIGAKQGTLAVMAGGGDADIERARPLLQTMSKSITHCGPVGSGQLTKLCNQILVSVTLSGVCEALLLAERNGLDPSIMIEAVQGGAAGSWQLANLGPKIVAQDFAPAFMIDLLQKDLRLVSEMSEVSHSPLPVTSLVKQLFVGAQAAGMGQDGTQALFKILRGLTETMG